MKTLLTFILIAAVAANAVSQLPLKVVKQHISDPEILKNWKVGEAKVFNDAKILRVLGDNEIQHRTNILYTPFYMISGVIEKKSDFENYTASQKQELIETFSKSAAGGQISIFYDREEKRLANPTLFTVSVIDESGKVIHTEKLQLEEPFYYRWGIWYFHKTINLPVAVSNNFTIEVNDAGINRDYRFQVTILNPNNNIQLNQLSVKK